MEETKGASPLKQNMITGSVMKNILVFSLPYLLSTFLQTLYGLADLFIIGWLTAWKARRRFPSAVR